MAKQKSSLFHSFLLLLAAFIWGVAFVAQTSGGDALGAYTFNSLRSFIGSLALLPVIKIFSSEKTKRMTVEERALEKTNLIKGGIACGLVLSIATNLQQLGLYFGSPAGKAGFLTACYIVIVPLLGMFLGQRNPWNIWVGLVIAVVGLYLLCMTDASFSFQLSDILLIGCALTFAVHIQVVSHFAPLVDGIKLSCIQFCICGILTAIPMIAVEIIPMGFGNWISLFFNKGAIIALLYAGVLSSGVGYTLQIVGQAKVQETIASMLMSLESVFSVLAGWMLLGQVLTMREIAGCVFIFVAVILAQLDFKSKRA